MVSHVLYMANSTVCLPWLEISGKQRCGSAYDGLSVLMEWHAVMAWDFCGMPLWPIAISVKRVSGWEPFELRMAWELRCRRTSPVRQEIQVDD